MAQKKQESISEAPLEEKSVFVQYWRLAQYIKPYLHLVVLCILASIAISILHFASLGMITPLADVLFSDRGDAIVEKLNEWGDTGKYLGNFLQTHVLSDQSRTINIFMIFIVILVVIKNILRFFHEYVTGYLTTKIAVDLSEDLFQKVLRLPKSYFSQEGVNQISGRFAYDIPVMAQGLRNLFGKAIREPLKAFSSLGLALLIDWELTILIFFIFPLVMVFVRKIGKKIKRSASKTLAQSSNLLNILQDSFRGIDIVKSYGMEKQREEKFSEENRKFFHYSMKVVKAEAVTSPVMEIFITAAAVFTLSLSASKVISGDMSPGAFCAFYVALGALFDPIRKLAKVYNKINAAVAASERVFDLMDQKHEREEEETLLALAPIQEEITFQGVSFGYGSDKLNLKNVSFTVKKGESVAVVGSNGAGKSTLVSLLLRLYDVNDGAILIDGQDISQVSLESLRGQIGLVTQQSFLFNDTFATNISCQRTADQSLSEIEKAAQIADAHSFLVTLEEGYETIYGQGIDVSGGQKHRVALARAIMKQPEILILDEVMANIDSESENYIKDALEKFIPGRTTFIIAHRFSTIQKADRILVLNQGEVECFGTHDEVMAHSETYSKLYLHQQEGS